MTTIRYNGDYLPIYFGYKAIDFLCGGIFPETIPEPAGLRDIVSLGVLGLNEGARRSGCAESYNEDEVWDMIDHQPDIISQISTLFTISADDNISRLIISHNERHCVG